MRPSHQSSGSRRYAGQDQAAVPFLTCLYQTHARPDDLPNPEIPAPGVVQSWYAQHSRAPVAAFGSRLSGVNSLIACQNLAALPGALTYSASKRHIQMPGPHCSARETPAPLSMVHRLTGFNQRMPPVVISTFHAHGICNSHGECGSRLHRLGRHGEPRGLAFLQHLPADIRVDQLGK